MSTTTENRRIRAHRSQTRRAGWWLLSSHLYMAAWFWGIILVLAVTGTLVFGGSGLRIGDDGSTTSIVSMGVQAAMWFTFAMAIALSMRQLTPHVAAGLTRRSFVRANLAVSVVMAAFYSAVMVLLLVVEHLVVRAGGWAPRQVDGVVFTGFSDAPRMFVVYLLVLLAAAAAGLVVGMAYHHLGGLWGTVLLVPSVPPLFVVMWLLVDRSSSLWLPAALDAELVRMLLCLAIAGGYALVYRATMRRVTV